VYMQQRYYDPIAMRFVSVDPVHVDTSSGGNFNRYWYANNSPYAYSDPSGTTPAHVAAAAGGGFVGGLFGLAAEAYRQVRDRDFDGPALAVETLKGGLVGATIGLTGGGSVLAGHGVARQVATTAAVSGGVSTGLHSVGEVAKGDAAPAFSESVDVGVTTSIGTLAGFGVSPISSGIHTTTIPAVAAYPVTALGGRVHYTVSAPAQQVTNQTGATMLNDTVGSSVEFLARPTDR
jgi:hypothetical protein